MKNQADCKKYQSNNKLKAFSLIELSIVILVIGILIAGIVAGTKLVDRIRLQTAISLTQSSPVAGIKNLAVWFESTASDAFSGVSVNNTSVGIGRDNNFIDNDYILYWFDRNPQVSEKSNAFQTTPTSPTRAWNPRFNSSGINGLPTVKFDGSLDYLAVSLTSVYGSSPIYNNFSIFVVAKPNNTISVVSEANSGILGSSGQKYLLWPLGGDAGISFGTNGVAVFEHGSGYLPALLFYQNPFNSDGTVINVNYSIKSGDSRTSSSLYINGNFIKNSLVSGLNEVGPPANIGGQPAAYGYFSGDVGELIIFARSLNAEERRAVNNYLKQKWEISS